MNNLAAPQITLDYSIDYEYMFTATDRVTGEILAAAISYDCGVANTRIDLQLIELGYDVYATEGLDLN